MAEPIEVEMPDGSVVEFPEGTAPAVMEKALAQYAAPKAEVPSLWSRIAAHPIDTLAEALPSVGGAVGGLLGSVPGAALGGMAGTGIKKLAQDGVDAVAGIPEIMRNVAEQGIGPTAKGFAEGVGEGSKAMLGEGALQGAFQGIGSAVGAGMKAVAPRLYQSALKPTLAMLKERAGGAAIGAGIGGGVGYNQGGVTGAVQGVLGGAAVGGLVKAPPKFVTALLEEGVPVTRKGIQQVEQLLQASQGELKSTLAGAALQHPGGVSPNAIAARLGPTAQKFGAQAAPQADLEAISKVGNEFLEAHGGAPLSLERLQELKQGTQGVLAGKYGRIAGAAPEAEKALARGMKEEIEQRAPGVSVINDHIGTLTKGKRALERRVLMESNKDIAGISVLAHGPKAFVLSLMDRNPQFKAMVANGLWRNADAVGQHSPDVLRGLEALRAIASEQDEP